MIARTLLPHADTPCPAVEEIRVTAIRDNKWLRVAFTVTGDIDALALPGPQAPERADGLWRTTCFEAFVRTRGAAYREFNLSPSGAWAAYRFSGYRDRMTNAAATAPSISLSCERDQLVLQAALLLPLSACWHVGLSAVIETHDGAKSYWALAHPPGAPDFHHEDCFAIELPPSRAA